MAQLTRANNQTTSQSNRLVMTPCVGICSTSIAGSVCRGCKRYAHEVIRWNGYSEEERQIVWRRLEEFRVTIMDNWLEVVDADLLKTQLDRQKIKFNPNLMAAAWAYDLLRAGASQIDDIEQYGLRLLPRCKEMPLLAVSEAIEKEYLTLSEAHYARYFSDVRLT